MGLEGGEPGPAPRRVRSFVRREGRVTRGQRRALERLGERYLLPDDGGRIDAEALFGRRAPLIIEIGCGNGDNLLARAAACPDACFLGVETYLSGIGGILRRIDAEGLDNVRLAHSDAVPLLRSRIAPHSVTGIWVFFPDPWPKKRHHKRRLVDERFLELAASRLTEAGTLRIATDWADYAAQIADAAARTPALSQLNPGAPRLRPLWRPVTRFEARGMAAGHEISDFAFVRSAGDCRRPAVPARAQAAP